MIRYVLPLLILAGLAADASACGRCGLFGRRCRFSCNHVVHKQVAYAAPASYSTNYVFNNLFPAPYLLAQQGQSVYGYQSASSAYQESSALYMDRAGRFAEQSLALASVAQTGFTQNAALAIQANDAADRRHTNAQIAALAMEANREPSNQTLQVTIQDGKMQAQYVQPQQVQQGPDYQRPQQLLQARSCASCHDGRGTEGAPKSIVLDGSVPLTDEILTASIKAIWSGRMPPKSNLTADQKAAISASLSRWQPTQTQPLPPPLPPENDLPPPPPAPPTPLPMDFD